MPRDSFIFYRSFFESILNLPEQNQLPIFIAMCKYSLDNEECELTGIDKAIFGLIKPQLDANNRKFVNGSKGAEYGKFGGRPTKKTASIENPTETPTKPQQNPTETTNEQNENGTNEEIKPQRNPKETQTKPQTNPNKTPNANVNDNVNDNENVNDNDNDCGQTASPMPATSESVLLTASPEKVKRLKKFIAPSESETTDYFKSATAGNLHPAAAETMARKFMSHYTANGWKQSRNLPIVDWRAAANGWILRDFGNDYEINKGVLRQKTPLNQPTATTDEQFGKEVEYLYQRFLENQLNEKTLKFQHYDFLKKIGQVNFTESERNELSSKAIKIRIKQLEGTNDAPTIRLMTAYMDRVPSPTQKKEIDKDVRNLDVIRKVLGLKLLFEQKKQQGFDFLLKQVNN